MITRRTVLSQYIRYIMISDPIGDISRRRYNGISTTYSSQATIEIVSDGAVSYYSRNHRMPTSFMAADGSFRQYWA